MLLIVSLVLLQLLIFAVLITLFRRIMTQNVNLATRHLDEMEKGYARKQEEINRQLQEADQKAQELIGQAQEEADEAKLEIVKQAETEREHIIKEARTRSEEMIQQADKSRQQLLTELEERISKEAVKKACQLIEETLPEQFKQDVHAHWIEDLITNGFNKLEKLHIPGEAGEVKVVSAFRLSDEQRRKITERLESVLSRQVTIKEEVDPKIVAGIVINIGSLVLDGSLKNKIHEKTK